MSLKLDVHVTRLTADLYISCQNYFWRTAKFGEDILNHGPARLCLNFNFVQRNDATDLTD